MRALAVALLVALCGCGRSLTAECFQSCHRVEPDGGCTAGPALCDGCGAKLCPTGFALVKDAGACGPIPETEKLISVCTQR